MDFNIACVVIDPDVNAPCKDLAAEFHIGDLQDEETVYQFGKKVDILTIEIEKVNVDALERLEAEGVPVFPQPSVIRTIQDKGLQKRFYVENNIPTADFKMVDSKGQIMEHEDFLPVFQKLRKDGYDGRGVQRINTLDDLDKAFEQPSLIEKLVDFDKEISVIVARNTKGQMKTFPVVELEFHPEANLVEFLFSPSSLSEALQKEAEEIAMRTAEAFGIVGLLAVEMFLTKDGTILVNEVAPRTHNSGHHTIEGNIVSQFEQQLRAILGMPLGDTAVKTPAVMVNVLGADGYKGVSTYEGLEGILAMPGVSLHLYGKKITKPFRKMGHVTVVNKDLDKAKAIAREVKETLKVISHE